MCYNSPPCFSSFWLSQVLRLLSVVDAVVVVVAGELLDTRRALPGVTVKTANGQMHSIQIKNKQILICYSISQHFRGTCRLIVNKHRQVSSQIVSRRKYFFSRSSHSTILHSCKATYNIGRPMSSCKKETAAVRLLNADMFNSTP